MSTVLIDRGLIPQAAFPDEGERAKAFLGTQSIVSYQHVPALTGLGGAGNDISGAVTNTFVSGAYRLTTAAVIGSWFRFTSGTFNGSFPLVFPSAAAWFVSARFRIDSAVDATTECYVGLADSGGASPLRLGVYGPSSAVNYVLQGPVGTFIDSGIPIDTALHTFRAYRTGGVTYCEVDDVRTTGNVDMTGDCCPVWQLKTGALAARQSSVQWWFGAAVTP